MAWCIDTTFSLFPSRKTACGAARLDALRFAATEGERERGRKGEMGLGAFHIPWDSALVSLVRPDERRSAANQKGPRTGL